MQKGKIYSGGIIKNESILINDLIILGRAVPERMKDGRVTICTAGYSPKYGFIRIYPTKRYMPNLKQWNIISVPLERNPKDSRKESWKIQGSKREWDKLHEKIKVVGTLTPKKRPFLIANLTDDCVNIINNDKRSLGIIKPSIKECFFVKPKNYDPYISVDLNGKPLTKVKEQYSIQPRIKYNCPKCQVKDVHNQQVLEWGFYEWFRKNPEDPEKVWDNAKIYSKEHDIFFFVGNLNQHKSSFLIIGILRFPKVPISRPLFPLKKC